MIVLFGNKSYFDILGYMVTTCPGCKTTSVMTVEQQRKKLTVYFIPTFDFSRKQYMYCGHCHERFEIDKSLQSTVKARLLSKKQMEKLMVELEMEKPRYECANCESRIEAGMKFCPQCGNNLG